MEAVMNFLELARERYSCRQLSNRKVEKEKLDKIIEAGILAPTATNAQPYKIWIIESDEAKEKLAKANRYQFGAEVFFVVGAKKDTAWVRKFDNYNFADVDDSIVATHMMLEIADLGLGTTWVGHFDEPLLKEEFPEMKDYELIAIFPVGYPAEDAKPAERHNIRRNVEEAVAYF